MLPSPPMDSTAAKALEVAEMSRNLAESARATAQQVRIGSMTRYTYIQASITWVSYPQRQNATIPSDGTDAWSNLLVGHDYTIK